MNGRFPRCNETFLIILHDYDESEHERYRSDKPEIGKYYEKNEDQGDLHYADAHYRRLGHLHAEEFTHRPGNSPETEKADAAAKKHIEKHRDLFSHFDCAVTDATPKQDFEGKYPVGKEE